MEEDKQIKKVVREGYAKIAKQGSLCCGPVDSCCGSNGLAQTIGRSIGYTDKELEAIPEGANLGLGCGNPVALASLREGETVLDLGSGAGFDCFLAAKQVGETGRVIGVDMTPEMVAKARDNAGKGNYANVEFRLGEIENLPVADSSVDVVISNCVVNLAPDKGRVFAEACRVLRPGGRLIVSDIVLLQELPDWIKSSIAAYIGCLAGAMMKEDYIAAVKKAGFQDVSIIDEASYPVKWLTNDPTVKPIVESLGIPPEELDEVVGSVVSLKVSGVRPN